MKKTILFILVLALILVSGMSVYAAGSNIRILNINEEVKSDDGQFLISYPKITSMSNEAVQEYLNVLIKDRVELAKVKINAAIYKGNPIDGAIDYETARNGGGIVSLVLNEYLYTGGANGTTQKIGFTFFSHSGQRLEMMDIFIPNSDGEEVINQEIRAQIEARGLKDHQIEEFTGITKNQPFYITDDAIVIMIPETTVFPHSDGVVEFSIPIDQMQQYFIDEIRPNT